MKDLNRAFPEMTDREHRALMDAASSVREEEQTVKRKLPKAIVIFAVLALMTATVAVAEGFGLLDYLTQDQGIAVLPGLETTADVLVAETEHAIFTVKEAVFDGYSGSALVEVQAKDEKTLLTPFWRGNQYTSAWDALHEEGTEDMAISEYMAAHGFEQLVMADVSFASFGEGGIGTVVSQSQLHDFHGNRATFLITFFVPSADVIDGTLTQDYRFTSCLCVTPPFPNGPRNEKDVAEGSFTVPVDTQPLWMRTAKLDEEQVFDWAMRITGVKLIGTRLGVYLEVEYAMPDRYIAHDVTNSQIFDFCLLDSSGTRLPQSLTGGSNRYNTTEEGQIYQTYRRSYNASETPPASGEWHFQITDNVNGTTFSLPLIWAE